MLSGWRSTKLKVPGVNFSLAMVLLFSDVVQVSSVLLRGAAMESSSDACDLRSKGVKTSLKKDVLPSKIVVSISPSECRATLIYASAVGRVSLTTHSSSHSFSATASSSLLLLLLLLLLFCSYFREQSLRQRLRRLFARTNAY